MEEGNTNSSKVGSVCPACGQLFTDKLIVCPEDNCLLVPVLNEELVGKLFDQKYRILGLLGQGGMGTVYKAMHKTLGTVVALKMLRLNLLEDEVAIARFKREAEVLSSLDHPNIVAIKEFNVTNSGQPYLVMDFLSGTALDSFLAAGKTIAPVKASSIFVQICDSLIQAHAKGIVHRDLKPGNILLLEEADGESMRPMLVDFGIAKLLPNPERKEQKLTRTGVAFGTPNYMSPEQWRGQKPDVRSDIYSLGSIMYECLTGSMHFELETLVVVMLENYDAEPRLPSQMKMDLLISREFEALIIKAISIDKEARQQSAAELKSALLQTPEYAQSCGESSHNRIPKFSRKERRKRLSLAITAVMTLIVVSLTFAFKLGLSGTAGIIPTRMALLSDGMFVSSTDLRICSLRYHLANLLAHDKNYAAAAVEFRLVIERIRLADGGEAQLLHARATRGLCEAMLHLAAPQAKVRTLAQKAITEFAAMADEFMNAKKFPQACNCMEESIALAKISAQNDLLAISEEKLADLQEHYASEQSNRTSLYAEAASHRRNALAILSAETNPDKATVSLNKRSLGYDLLKQGRDAEAEPILLSALAQAEAAYPQNHQRLESFRDVVFDLGLSYYANHDYKAADRVWQSELVSKERSFGGKAVESAHLLEYLGACNSLMHQQRVAESCFRKALLIREKYEPLDKNYNTGLVLLSLADCLAGQNKLREAIFDLQRCIPIFRRGGPAWRHHLQLALQSYAAALTNSGRLSEAKQALVEYKNLSDASANEPAAAG